jgi:hypothetical protein
MIQLSQGMPLDNNLIPAVASGLASLGRFEDTYMVHAAKGETVIPKEVLDADPILKEQLFQQMRAIGIINPERYVVGNQLNSINPVTGQPEFFLKGVKKFFKRALPVIGAVIGGIYGGGSFGAAAGSFLGSKLAGQPTETAVLSAAISGLGSAILGPVTGAAPAAGAAGAAPATALSAAPGAASVSLANLVGELGLGAANQEMVHQAIASGLPSLLMASTEDQGDPLAGAGARADPIGRRYKELWAELGIDKYADWDNDAVPPPPQLTDIASLRTSTPDASALMLSPEEQLALQQNLMGVPGGQSIFPMRPPQPVVAQAGGMISGPGGPKDDEIPAMLSDGEFVFTAQAVQGADPNGSRRDQAREMYRIMRGLEGRA